MDQISMNLDLKIEDEVVPKKDSDQEPASSEPQVFTITQLNQAIRGTLEGKFHTLWVRGEISNFKPHTSGHWYFSLKDNNSQISAVMFRGHNSRLRFKPENGMEVMIRGKVTVYEPRGNYQVFCEMMEPVGAGALQKAFEQLKSKLEKEGLFDQARKRPLPILPQHVAIVTSPTGAAIRDMLNVLNRRFKGLRITLVPAVVQGDQAPSSIVNGIQLANRLTDVDVLIVGRGGGSIEDLWGFNDEKVARAIAASRLPVISAVGHEVDFTIADFVADLRAPTPSAAAELVVKSATEIKERLQISFNRFARCMRHELEVQRRKVQNLKRHLVDPRRRLQDLIQRNDELTQRLQGSVKKYFERRRLKLQLLTQKMVNPKDLLRTLQLRQMQAHSRLSGAIKTMLKNQQSQLRSYLSLLDSLSPLRVVDRGYSIVKKEQAVVKSIKQVKGGDELLIRVTDGQIRTKVEKTESL